jgi:hypothetical protein
MANVLYGFTHRAYQNAIISRWSQCILVQCTSAIFFLVTVNCCYKCKKNTIQYLWLQIWKRKGLLVVLDFVAATCHTCTRKWKAYNSAFSFIQRSTWQTRTYTYTEFGVKEGWSCHSLWIHTFLFMNADLIHAPTQTNQKHTSVTRHTSLQPRTQSLT